MGVNLLKIEQDKNNQIIEMKQMMAQTRQQLDDHVANLKKLEAALLTKEKELQSMTDKYDMQVRDKNDCQDQNMRLNN